MVSRVDWAQTAGFRGRVLRFGTKPRPPADAPGPPGWQSAGRPWFPVPVRSSQNAPVPLGVPSPVGPSQPVREVHHWVVGHVPLLPLVTSNSDPVCAYGVPFA